MTVAIVDYGAGNLHSVQKAFRHLETNVRIVTGDVADLSWAEAIVVPGVGHFEATRSITDTCRRAVALRVADGAPVLGICLGMQWLFEGSDEAPGLAGFGAIPGRCCRLTGADKIPHVGWNQLARTPRPSRLLMHVSDDAATYFTHAYAAPVNDATVAMTTHGVTFASVVERGGVYGTQFHPEKSGAAGLQILAAFIAIAREARVSC